VVVRTEERPAALWRMARFRFARGKDARPKMRADFPGAEMPGR